MSKRSNCYFLSFKCWSLLHLSLSQCDVGVFSVFLSLNVVVLNFVRFWFFGFWDKSAVAVGCACGSWQDLGPLWEVGCCGIVIPNRHENYFGMRTFNWPASDPYVLVSSICMGMMLSFLLSRRYVTCTSHKNCSYFLSFKCWSFLRLSLSICDVDLVSVFVCLYLIVLILALRFLRQKCCCGGFTDLVK